MDARAVRERRHGDRAVALGRAGDQIGEVVGDDEAELAVRQHGGLRAASGAGCVEIPERLVGVDLRHRLRRTGVLCHQRFVAVLALTRATDGDHLAQLRRCRFHRIDVVDKAFFGQHHAGLAGTAEVGDFRRREPEVDRHPDRAEPERGPAAFEQRRVVARHHQQLVARFKAERTQRLHQRIDAVVEFAPRPLPVALDEPRPIGKQRRRLRQQRRQIHRACAPRHAHAASSTLR